MKKISTESLIELFNRTYLFSKFYQTDVNQNNLKQRSNNYFCLQVIKWLK